MKSTTFKSTVMGLVLAMGSSFVAPKADAAIALGAAFEPAGVVGASLQLITCALLLPVCILDEKPGSVSAMTKQDLLDSGYSASQADALISETARLAATLASKNERLVVKAGDTQASIASDITSVMPDASAEFINFYSQLSTSR